ncbi:MAG: hypothetical protein IJS76_09005 [Pseudobutyrivibrio sp.]|nr:hypothetical protein [Pseudobutyrivibrio sp.]
MPTSISDLTSGNNPLDERKRLAQQFLDIATFYKDLGTDKDYNAIKSYLEREIDHCNYLQRNGIPDNRNIKNNKDLRNATSEYLGRTVVDNANFVCKDVVKDLNTVRGKKYYSKNLTKARAKRNKNRRKNYGLNKPIIPEQKNQFDKLQTLDDRSQQSNDNTALSNDRFFDKGLYEQFKNNFNRNKYGSAPKEPISNYGNAQNSGNQGSNFNPENMGKVKMNLNLGFVRIIVIKIPRNRQNIPQINNKQPLHPQNKNDYLRNRENDRQQNQYSHQQNQYYARPQQSLNNQPNWRMPRQSWNNQPNSEMPRQSWNNQPNMGMPRQSWNNQPNAGMPQQSQHMSFTFTQVSRDENGVTFKQFSMSKSQYNVPSLANNGQNVYMQSKQTYFEARNQTMNSAPEQARQNGVAPTPPPRSSSLPRNSRPFSGPQPAQSPSSSTFWSDIKFNQVNMTQGPGFSNVNVTSFSYTNSLSTTTGTNRMNSNYNDISNNPRTTNREITRQNTASNSIPNNRALVKAR